MIGDLVADVIPIHLMVTDVVMPEMNKRELAEHLARSRCSVSSCEGWDVPAYALQDRRELAAS